MVNRTGEMPRTITLDHERLNNVVSDHLKVGVTNPVADGGLGAGEEVVDDRDFMPEEHKTIDKVRSDKTSATSDKDALAVGGR